MKDLSSSARGRVGEFIAAAAIELLGWRVLLSPTEQIDLVAIRGDTILRVQVKASRRYEEPDRAYARYRFLGAQGNADAIDVMALVDLINRRVRFTRPTAQRMLSLRDEDFGPDVESETWREVCTAALGGR